MFSPPETITSLKRSRSSMRPSGVHDGGIARVQPAAAEGLGRGCGVVEVARHHGVAAQHDLAHRAAVARHRRALGVPDVDRAAEHRRHALAGAPHARAPRPAACPTRAATQPPWPGRRSRSGRTCASAGCRRPRSARSASATAARRRRRTSRRARAAPRRGARSSVISTVGAAHRCVAPARSSRQTAAGSGRRQHDARGADARHAPS